MGRFLMLMTWMAALSVVSVSLADETDTIDYTCDPNLDYAVPKPPGSCPAEKIQNGICESPNHGGDDDSCAGQDCIDCNKFCRGFDADCFGCLNAKGCYYCPGDATCQNSDLYQSSIKVLSCTAPDDFWLGGRDDPDEFCIPSDSLTQDPQSLTNNWMYKMINIDKVWPEYTGKGISIRINDLGIDPNNDDFEGRFDEANSCDNYLPFQNDDGTLDPHGTRVAGVIVGNANNNFCAAGIAYDATFTACNVASLPNANYNVKIESIDISMNAIQVFPCGIGTGDSGASALQTTCPFSAPRNEFNDPCNPDICDFENQEANGLSDACENAIFAHCEKNYRDDETACLDFINILLDGGECNYDKIPGSAIDALTEGATQGRDGKGIVYVFASGNGFYKGEDVNFSRWPNSRFTITVGAVGKDGLHADYSTPGAALTVSGPAGDSDDATNIITTGLGNTCTNSGRGTSFSSPVVAGVIALMLEARPELTWRDVQAILQETSTLPADPRDNTRETNAAGITHSMWYGFGIVDAKKAVDTALAWTLLTPEYQAIGQSEEENQAIPNDGTEYVSELTMSSDYSGFTAAATVVLVNLQHYQRGDLELTLVSPSGTESILHPGRRPEDNQPTGDNRWKLMTLRNWGEDPTGTWQLKFKDLETGSAPSDGLNELRQWKIVVYGQTEDGLPPVLSSQTPTGAPTFTDRSGGGGDNGRTSAPTISAAPTTLKPTLSPTEIRFIRPTKIVKGPEPIQGAPEPIAAPIDDTRVELPDSRPGTRFQPVPVVRPERNPLDPGLLNSGNRVIMRPVYIVGTDPTVSENNDPRAPLVAPFVKFTEDAELEEGSHLSFKLLQNVSLVLQGVDEDIPQKSWESLQNVLEDHTMAVVSEMLPDLHILSEIHLTSVTVHSDERNHDMRSLQPANGPFVIIMYDEMIRFDELSWTENLLGIDLAGLPFSDVQSRGAFVSKLKSQLDKDEHSWMENLVSVSPLVQPPTEEGASVETPIVFSSGNSTEVGSAVEGDVVDSSSNNTPENSIETIAEVEDETIHPPSTQNNSESSTQIDSVDDTINLNARPTSIIWWVGAGIVCATLIFVFRRRRLRWGSEEEEGLSNKV